jgi:hypothetical protein
LRGGRRVEKVSKSLAFLDGEAGLYFLSIIKLDGGLNES